MSKIKKYRKSEDAAIENVKRFFSRNPDDDVISLEQAFTAWGRSNPEDADRHKTWLANTLSHIKYYGLIMPVYSYENARKKLVKLQLTNRGKKVLGRIEGIDGRIEHHNSTGKSHTLTLEEVAEAIPKLREKHKTFNIVFSFTPKEDKEEG